MSQKAECLFISPAAAATISQCHMLPVWRQPEMTMVALFSRSFNQTLDHNGPVCNSHRASTAIQWQMHDCSKAQR